MLQRPVPCPNCQYDLRAGLTEDGARCPECGEQTSAAILLEPSADQHARLRRWVIHAHYVPMICVVISFFVPHWPGLVPLIASVAAACGACFVYGYQDWNGPQIGMRLCNGLGWMIRMLMTNFLVGATMGVGIVVIWAVVGLAPPRRRLEERL